MARRPERSRASLDHTRLAHDRLWLAGLWLLAFLLYAATTTLDVLPADSGEFQLIAAGWGIGHPPGYPLYTMAAAMWLRIIPVGALPFRASLFSAALAATTLTILARAVELWAGTLGATRRHARLGGALAALALGTASTYWAQATTANIRMPTMLFVAWGYLALAHYRDARGNANRCRRALLELGITAGLGVGHHPSLAFIAAGWAAYLLFESPGTFLRPRQWYRAAFAAAAVWFLPQLYLPLRGAMQNVPLNPGGLSSWKGFWDHVLARGFGGDMLAYATSHDLALRLPLLPTLFRMQFPTLVLVAMALGWAWVLRRDRSTALSLLIAWLAQTFFTITYRAPQTVEYLMPAYVPMAMVLGLAAASRPARGRGAAQRLFATVVGLITLILGLQLPGHVRDFAALAHDTSIRARVEPLLRQAPAGATILADWHWATPLWVLQAVEGLSPDVTVSYVYPEDGRDYDEVWRARAEAASGAPLFTTHAYTWEGWTAAPVGGGYRLYAQPLLSLPFELGFTSINADLGPIRLLGARFGAARFGAASAKPGATVELQLAWQAKDPAADASFATRLWDNDQALLSASDLALGADTETEGIHFATLTHQLPIDRCSPIVHPTVSIYTATDTGYLDLGALSLPAFEVDCRYPTLPTERFWPGVVSGQGPFLRGIDYDVRQASAT
ncbi:MAG: DUF2723 domain-containing protein, partial [Anaerolineae bacterium]|nr:DUF2723 domain-containing protein [Anaerolineae bacterium]